MLSRYDISIAGETYILKPGTFSEGAVRRQVEVYTLQDTDFKSRPDMREFWQTSWLGGSRWEQPVYNLQNLDTYYNATQLSFTDRGGAARPSRRFLGPGGSDLSNDVIQTKVVPWFSSTIKGVAAIKDVGAGNHRWVYWDGSSFQNGSDTFAKTGDVVAAAAGNSTYVYAMYDDGYLSRWDTTTTTEDLYDTGLDIYPGTTLWVADSLVWCYNGDQVYSMASADSFVAAVEANDGDGPDILRNMSQTSWINKWSTPRAIPTAEGVFYVKNSLQGGTLYAKIYRLDRDATGVYILTPVATLSPETVAMTIGYHLSSLIIGTVSNRWEALLNAANQRVTFYHVTGGSVGAIGSPMGGDALTDTPVWVLGSDADILYIGGKSSIWEYDARIGAIHSSYRYDIGAANTFTPPIGGGFTQMLPFQIGTGGSAAAGLMFMHDAPTLGTDPPQFLYKYNAQWNGAVGFVESNWIDFDLPMEQKTITELFYDTANLTTSETVQIQLLADSGTWDTVATVTSASAGTARVALATPLTGYKFRYRINVTVTSGARTAPLDILAIGFSASAGEMVKVLQFTIDGTESVNIENNVQIPYNVYTTLATLRDNQDAVTVRHWMVSDEGSDYAEDSYKVISVTAAKDMPSEGFYEVVLMEA